MKKEYDFSKMGKGEVGKHYRPNARLIPPVHLEPEALAIVSNIAEKKGVTINQLINSLVKTHLSPL